MRILILPPTTNLSTYVHISQSRYMKLVLLSAESEDNFNGRRRILNKCIIALKCILLSDSFGLIHMFMVMLFGTSQEQVSSVAPASSQFLRQVMLAGKMIILGKEVCSVVRGMHCPVCAGFQLGCVTAHILPWGAASATGKLKPDLSIAS